MIEGHKDQGLGIRDQESGSVGLDGIVIHIKIMAGFVFARFFALEVIDVTVKQSMSLSGKITPALMKCNRHVLQIFGYDQVIFGLTQ